MRKPAPTTICHLTVKLSNLLIGIVFLIGFTGLLCANPLPEADAWLTFMGNSRRTGSVADSAGPEVGEQIWTFRDGISDSPFAASPADSGGRIYVGSDDCRLYCLDAFTGRLIWKFETVYEVFASPAVVNGRVYVGEGLHYTDEAKLYCLDAFTGNLLWNFQTGSHVEFSPTVFDGRVYFGAGEDGVYCLDARNGQKLWQYRGVHVDMSPGVTGQGVFFGTVYGESSFYRLDPKNGELLWKRPAPYDVSGSPSVDGERVYFGLGNGTFDMSHAQPRGSAWCLSIFDGDTVWQQEVKDAVLTTIAIHRDRAYFGSRDGRLYCVDAASGGVHWEFNTGIPILSSPAIAGERVYFGADNGFLYCLDAASGKEVWRYDASQISFSADARIISSPAVANGYVYVGSMNSFFFCLGNVGKKE